LTAPRPRTSDPGATAQPTDCSRSSRTSDPTAAEICCPQALDPHRCITSPSPAQHSSRRNMAHDMSNSTYRQRAGSDRDGRPGAAAARPSAVVGGGGGRGADLQPVVLALAVV
jgi:hypothetical protein